MRLLQRNDDGRYTLEVFVGDNIPDYAILSHTWDADSDEVTSADLEKDTNTTKAGYRKLKFCADQAAKNNLCYFWVDTCCIDKTSSAELTEAINSMFAWYRDATRCYVYLSDVSTGSLTSEKPVQQDWHPAFQQSRWFTRGWTLQELLAPTSVEFFSKEGDRLGDKVSIMQELQDITKINPRALQGASLSEFTIEERMSWTTTRDTKRKEDAAYSLLGIFDIHIPLIYGEGREKAFGRLNKEIEQSPAQQEKKRRTMDMEKKASMESAKKLLEAAKRAREDAEAKAAKVREVTAAAHRHAMDEVAAYNLSLKFATAETAKVFYEEALAEAATVHLALKDAMAEAVNELEEMKVVYEKVLAESRAAIKKMENAKTALEEETAKLMLSDICKPPIKFKDAVGHQFSLPWHLCKTWKVWSASISPLYPKLILY
jgi:hypothetical protein